MTGMRDADLKQRVVNFLQQKNVMRRDNVFVDVQEGLVTLGGRVGTYYEKQLFLSACQRVAGVVSVVDNIAVESLRSEAAETLTAAG